MSTHPLDSAGGWAAQAALTAVVILPLLAAWGFSLRSVSHSSKQLRMGCRFLRAAPPVLALGLVLYTAAVALYASHTEPDESVLLASYYLIATGAFLTTAASILVTSALYMFGLATLHLALGRLKRWEMFRIDVLVGATLFFVLDLAYWAKNLTDLGEDGIDFFSYGSWRVTWLMVIVDGSMALMTAGLVGLAIYLKPKVAKKLGSAAGNLANLLLAATLVWIFRCTFAVSIDIKFLIDDWKYSELQAQKIILPFFDYWLSVTTIILLVIIARYAIWSDASLHLPVPVGPASVAPPPQGAPIMLAVYPNGVAYVQQPVPGAAASAAPSQVPVFGQQPIYVQQLPPQGYPALQPVSHVTQGGQPISLAPMEPTVGVAPAEQQR